MKSALLFPGLDALYVPSKFKQWLALPMVQTAVEEVSSHLGQLTGREENLAALLTENRVPHLADFDRATVALTGVQIGIARGLREKTEWDFVIGCSHGDIARSVTCGVLSVTDAVEVVWSFAQLRNSAPPGRTANVRTTDGTPLTLDQIDWLSDQGGALSLWSSHHATVAADSSTIEKLAERSRKMNLKVKPVFPFAIHSPHMSSVATTIESYSPKWQLNDSRWPIFSSIYRRLLINSSEIRAEAIAGAVSPINWVEAIQVLCSEHEVRRLVNVGPSNALTGQLLFRGALENLQIDDAAVTLGLEAR